MSTLIVGANSLAGKYFLDYLLKNKIPASGTTRRQNSSNIYLDLNSPETFFLKQKFNQAYIFAGITNYKACENKEAFSTNIEKIFLLIKTLIEQKIFVSFISTNSLFDGENPWPDEQSSPNPKISYSIQKYEVEKLMMNYLPKNSFNIIRLTKIITLDTPPLPTWFEAVKIKSTIKPFDDLIISPITLPYLSKSLLTMTLSQKNPGIFHLSGDTNINYFEFALKIFEKFKLNTEHIIRSNSTDNNINILYKPKFSGLSMRHTKEKYGIDYLTLDKCIDDLYEDFIIRKSLKNHSK